MKNLRTKNAYWKTFVIVLPGIFVFLSCGYRFTDGFSASGKQTTFFVYILQNQTRDYGAEVLFTNHLTGQLLRAPGLRLADAETADIHISGEIFRIVRETVSRTGTHTPIERRVKVILHLLVKDSEGNLLWEGKKLHDSEVYEVESDPLNTEINRKNALEKVAGKIAETASIAVSEALSHTGSRPDE